MQSFQCVICETIRKDFCFRKVGLVKCTQNFTLVWCTLKLTLVLCSQKLYSCLVPAKHYSCLVHPKTYSCLVHAKSHTMPVKCILWLTSSNVDTWDVCDDVMTPITATSPIKGYDERGRAGSTTAKSQILFWWKKKTFKHICSDLQLVPTPADQVL